MSDHPRSVRHVVRVQCLAYVGGYISDARKLERCALSDLRRGATANALDNTIVSQACWTLAALYALQWLLR
jgi:hypothetical protein